MRASQSAPEHGRSTPRYRGPSTEPFHLLLVTNRPPVHAFFAGLGRRSAGAYALTQLPVEPDAVTEARHDLEGASAAVVDAGLDAAAAILVCQEIDRKSVV